MTIVHKYPNFYRIKGFFHPEEVRKLTNCWERVLFLFLKLFDLFTYFLIRLFKFMLK